jgi:hypothetical protein
MRAWSAVIYFAVMMEAANLCHALETSLPQLTILIHIKREPNPFSILLVDSPALPGYIMNSLEATLRIQS